MGKSRYTYRTYTTSQLKNRSSIPSTGNISEQSGYIDCTNISLNAVKSLLGESVASLWGCSQSTALNHWSGYGPTTRALSGSGYSRVLVNSHPTIARLGDFAGYNHNAVIPGWQSGGQAVAEANNWINSGSQATCNANIDIGEIDWQGEFSAVGVAMLVFDSTDAIVGWGYTSLSGVGSNFTLSGTTTIMGGIVVDKLDWYAMAFIVDQVITTPEDVVSSVVCRVPNISTWEINLKAKAATFMLNDGYNGWTVSNPSFNLSAGTAGFSDATKNTNLTNIRVTVQLINWLGNSVGSEIEIFYQDNWSPTDQMFTCSGKPNGDPIDAYGYMFKLNFYETI